MLAPLRPLDEECPERDEVVEEDVLPREPDVVLEAALLPRDVDPLLLEREELLRELAPLPRELEALRGPELLVDNVAAVFRPEDDVPRFFAAVRFPPAAPDALRFVAPRFAAPCRDPARVEAVFVLLPEVLLPEVLLPELFSSDADLPEERDERAPARERDALPPPAFFAAARPVSSLISLLKLLFCPPAVVS